MSTLREEAISYSRKYKLSCIECGRELKHCYSIRCRPCYYLYFKQLSAFVKGFNRESNGMWKGDKVGYFALHNWIKRHKPKPEFCEICKIKEPKQIANISGKYKRDINDFEWLCIRCHVYKDGTVNNLNIHNRRKKEVVN